MTVRSRNAKRDQRIKRMLLECYPVTTIARFTNLSAPRVCQIKDMFIADGGIMAVVLHIVSSCYPMDRLVEKNIITNPLYSHKYSPSPKTPLMSIGDNSEMIEMKGQMDMKMPVNYVDMKNEELMLSGSGKSDNSELSRNLNTAAKTLPVGGAILAIGGFCMALGSEKTSVKRAGLATAATGFASVVASAVCQAVSYVV